MKLKKERFIFDTIGIGIFTTFGLQKTLDIGLSVSVALMMSAVSAVFDGIVRYILCAEITLVFHREISASVCLAGGLFYLGLQQFIPNTELNMIIPILVVFTLRYFAVKRKWTLNYKNID